MSQEPPDTVHSRPLPTKDWLAVLGTVPFMNKLLILAGAVAGVAASATAGALATDPDSTYYRTLVKPAGSPRHRCMAWSGLRCTRTSR